MFQNSWSTPLNYLKGSYTIKLVCSYNKNRMKKNKSAKIGRKDGRDHVPNISFWLMIRWNKQQQHFNNMRFSECWCSLTVTE